MDDREWIRTAMAHKDCPVPYNISLSPVALRKLREHCGVDNVADWMGLPIRMTNVKAIKPLYADPDVYGDTIRDEFGVIWSTNPIDRGSPIGPCLLEPDLSAYKFPDPTVPYRFEDLDGWCRTNADHFTIIWSGDLLERAIFMRGMEDLMLDLAMNQAFAAGLLRGIADYILATLQIMFSRFTFDGIAISDDYGTQRAMVMSPKMWRELIKPLLAEIYALAKRHNRTVFSRTFSSICWMTFTGSLLVSTARGSASARSSWMCRSRWRQGSTVGSWPWSCRIGSSAACPPPRGRPWSGTLTGAMWC